MGKCKLKFDKFTDVCMTGGIRHTLSVRSEGPTLEISAFKFLYGGQCAISTQLINPFLFHFSTDTATQFLKKLKTWSTLNYKIGVTAYTKTDV